MKKILINGLSAKTAGGRSVFVNLVQCLVKQNSADHYFLLVAKDTFDLLNITAGSKIHHIEVNQFYSISYFMLITYVLYLPKLIHDLEIDVVLNLADVPIKTQKPQVLLFDWSYAVYPHSIIWKIMPLYDKLYRNIKIWFFKRHLKYIDLTLAQSKIIKHRLQNVFNLKKVKIAPNAVSLDNLDGGLYKDFNLPSGPKFLYLTRYYPHKNLQIFVDLAEKIKIRNKDWKLIITIDRNQGKASSKLINTINSKGLNNIIINIGSVEMNNVPSLYKQCDYLLMPTLLESFSGTYVEAMYHKMPILTSDLDFARTVCEDAALYFDPLNSNSIFKAMELIVDNKIEKELVKKGNENLLKMASWTDTAKIINNAINKLSSV